MTASEDAPLDATSAEHAALLDQLADKLGVRAPGAIVFGEAVERQGVTVIPVARVGFGYGFGAKAPKESGTDLPAGGAGEARPLGFLEIKEGRAAYKPIRDPWAHVLAPLVGGLLAGAAGASVLRHLVRRRR
ncbi:spore germination protein GerW family protein [Streptomyces monashensis]|uniref:GerW family sporulation protein n=1 Tax=Streptomyces monashensis TaxID=1678012 RepID=UPI0033CF076E